MKRVMQEMMGTRLQAPAEYGESGTFKDGLFGLVAIKDEFKHEYAEVYGQVGYYDDDAWQPFNEDTVHTMTEAGFEEDELGCEVAIVYFGEPLVGPYLEIDYDYLRPATQEEALAYSLRNQGPIQQGQA